MSYTPSTGCPPSCGRSMHIRCPHCQHAIEIVEESPLLDVECPSCGSSFNLLSETTTARYDPATPRRLGIFELLEPVGMGACGTVWKARDTELHREVAIKIPRKEQLSATELEQFVREARAAAQLKHANIVSVHEVGRDEGTVFIVSDFIHGQTLSEWLTARRLTAHDAATLCHTLAEALHHAHEQGVIHRDLKPGNIMLDGDQTPHLMDFGLAKREAGEITMTADGQVLGTPAYMSPEQARGEGHHADRRSDVYSMGVIFFELLTGEKPFRGSVRMLLHQVLHDEPPKLRQLNGDVPRDLETICLKCLEKDPTRRYQTARELADDLGRWLSGEPILARPISLVERTWRWSRKNAVLAASLAAVTMALGIGTLVGLWIAGKSQHGSQVAPETHAAEIKNTPLSAGGGVDLNAASQTTISSSESDTSELAQQAYNILKENCHICHGETVKVKGLYVLERASLLSRRDEDRNPYITPGDKEKSVLWEAAVKHARMPPEKPLSKEQEDILTRWIEAGAHFPSVRFPSVREQDRPFISEREILSQIADHLFEVNSEDRRYQRYFSIAHLHNDESFDPAELRKFRAAFAKVVNSLSRGFEIVVPTAIDEHETVFNIDLRHFGWEDSSVWDKVVSAYPYGLRPQQSELGAEEYRRLEELYGQALFDGIPYMRADWFVVQASRPPLYHDLLDIPETLDELLADLEIDIKRNLENNRARRGGVFQSGVSRQNRLIEYHPSRGGFWLSYDFKKNASRSNLARFPLGPKDDLPNFENFAFEHAGGEVIFSLRNGLSGYMLVDEKGNRIDVGPIEIVSDADETSGTHQIVNGISCMNCHKRGPFRFQDVIRESHAVSAEDARRKIDALYAGRSEMDGLLNQESNRFLRQLEKAIGPFIKAGEHADTPFSVLVDAEEPVKFVARGYDRVLDLERVASELGYADSTDFANALKAPSLADLGLSPLRMTYGVVKRFHWESREEGISVFQRTASALGRGMPVPLPRASAPQSQSTFGPGKPLDRVVSEIAEGIEAALKDQSDKKISIGNFQGPPRTSAGRKLANLLEANLKTRNIELAPFSNWEVRGIIQIHTSEESVQLEIQIELANQTEGVVSEFRKLAEVAADDIGAIARSDVRTPHVTFLPGGSLDRVITEVAEDIEVALRGPNQQEVALNGPNQQTISIGKFQGPPGNNSGRILADLLETKLRSRNIGASPFADLEVRGNFQVDESGDSAHVVIQFQLVNQDGVQVSNLSKRAEVQLVRMPDVFPDSQLASAQGVDDAYTLHVLALGSDNYDGINWARLKYPVEDVRSIIRALHRDEDMSKLYKFDHELPLFNELITPTAVESYINEIQRRLNVVGPKDVVLVYLSGHSKAIDGQYYYIPPMDTTDPEEVKRRAISWAQLEELNSFRCHVIWMLDTCEAGAVADSKSMVLRVAATGNLVFAAASGTDATFEGEQYTDNEGNPHSAFAAGVLRALDGEADGAEGADGVVRKDGIVTVDEMVHFVQRYVYNATGRNQLPTFIVAKDAAIMKLPLARVIKRSDE